jgi:hypothetical protein
MEIKKNFARKIDSKLKKSTIIGIMATYSGNVVPNAVTRLRGYFRNMKMEGRGRYFILYRVQEQKSRELGKAKVTA